VKLVTHVDLHLFNSRLNLLLIKPSLHLLVTRGYLSKDNNVLLNCLDRSHVVVSEVVSEEVVVWIEIVMVVDTEVAEVVFLGTGMVEEKEIVIHLLLEIDTVVVGIDLLEAVVVAVVVMVALLVITVLHHVTLDQVGMMTGHHLQDIVEVAAAVLGLMTSLAAPLPEAHLPVVHLLGNVMITGRGRVMIEGIQGMVVGVVVDMIVMVGMVVMVVMVVVTVVVIVMILVIVATIIVIVILEVIGDVAVVHHEVVTGDGILVLLLETDTITTGPEVALLDIKSPEQHYQCNYNMDDKITNKQCKPLSYCFTLIQIRSNRNIYEMSIGLSPMPTTRTVL